MRGKPFRIVNPWLKFVTVVVVSTARLAGFWAIPPDFAPLAMSVFYAASGLVLLYAATRVFRVREEPLVTPRAWWRATGRPAAGFVIAGLIAASTVGYLVTRGAEEDVGGLVMAVAIDLSVIAFYLHSSFRLIGQARDTSLLPTRSSDV